MTNQSSSSSNPLHRKKSYVAFSFDQLTKKEQEKRKEEIRKLNQKREEQRKLAQKIQTDADGVKVRPIFEVPSSNFDDEDIMPFRSNYKLHLFCKCNHKHVFELSECIEANENNDKSKVIDHIDYIKKNSNIFTIFKLEHITNKLSFSDGINFKCPNCEKEYSSKTTEDVEIIDTTTKHTSCFINFQKLKFKDKKENEKVYLFHFYEHFYFNKYSNSLISAETGNFILFDKKKKLFRKVIKNFRGSKATVRNLSFYNLFQHFFESASTHKSSVDFFRNYMPEPVFQFKYISRMLGTKSSTEKQFKKFILVEMNKFLECIGAEINQKDKNKIDILVFDLYKSYIKDIVEHNETIIDKLQVKRNLKCNYLYFKLCLYVSLIYRPQLITLLDTLCENDIVYFAKVIYSASFLRKSSIKLTSTNMHDTAVDIIKKSVKDWMDSSFSYANVDVDQHYKTEIRKRAKKFKINKNLIKIFLGKQFVLESHRNYINKPTIHSLSYYYDSHYDNKVEIFKLTGYNFNSLDFFKAYVGVKNLNLNLFEKYIDPKQNNYIVQTSNLVVNAHTHRISLLLTNKHLDHYIRLCAETKTKTKDYTSSLMYIDTIRCIDLLNLNHDVIFKIKDNEELRRFHDDIAKKYNIKKDAKLQKQFSNFIKQIKSINKFTSLKHKIHFELISQIDDLVKESFEMNHCVKTYFPQMSQSKYIAYKVYNDDESKRATLGIHVNIKEDLKEKFYTFVFDQIKSKNNNIPCEEILEAGKEFLKKIKDKKIKVKAVSKPLEKQKNSKNIHDHEILPF